MAEGIAKHFDQDYTLCATLLGASGVGKTTAAKQALQMMRKNGVRCWEHKSDHTLSAVNWHLVAQHLKDKEFVGVLLVDDAHQHLQELNDLIDKCPSSEYLRQKAA